MTMIPKREKSALKCRRRSLTAPKCSVASLNKAQNKLAEAWLPATVASGQRTRTSLLSNSLIKKTQSVSLKNTPNTNSQHEIERPVKRTTHSSTFQASSQVVISSSATQHVSENSLKPQEETSAHLTPEPANSKLDKGNSTSRQLSPRAAMSEDDETQTLLLSTAPSNSATTILCTAEICLESSFVKKELVQSTSSSIELATPWMYYRRVMSEQLAQWSKMCDKVEFTKSKLQAKCPSLFRHLSLQDFDPTNQEPLEETISEFIEQLENLLPDEYRECLFYAFVLVEEAFGRGEGIFVHTNTVKRILGIAYGFAFKLLGEIDWMSLNKPLAHLLGLSQRHFNSIESEMFAALNYDISISQDKFESRLAVVSCRCTDRQRASQQLLWSVTATKDVAIKEPDAETEDKLEERRSPLYADPDTASEETKVSSKSRQQEEEPEGKRLGTQHPSGFDVCSSPDSVASDSSEQKPNFQTHLATGQCQLAIE